LAEKRKSALDQMAIERQYVDRLHREQVEKIHEEHKKTLIELTEQLTGEKKLRKEVEDLQQKLTDMKTRLQASEEKCSWFERTLTRTEETANTEREQNKKITEDLIEKHNQDMTTFNEGKEKQLEEMTSQIEEVNNKMEQEAEQHSKEIEANDQQIAQLTQELKDKQVENRIAGKKGDQLVKDLKRQYRLERKRADQLQLKLQEALSENRAKQSKMIVKRCDGDGKDDNLDDDDNDDDGNNNENILVLDFDELFSSPGQHQRQNSGDSSILSPNRSDIDSPDIRSTLPSQPPSPSSSIAGLLSEDTTDLIERLADVQQEKWLLEEKVRHLEDTGGALADDLMQKSNIIQTYAMKTKIGPINDSPKSPSISSFKEKMKSSLNIGRTKTDTKKLQMMLEETLMKNVQLQEHFHHHHHLIIFIIIITITFSSSSSPSHFHHHHHHLSIFIIITIILSIFIIIITIILISIFIITIILISIFIIITIILISIFIIITIILISIFIIITILISIFIITIILISILISIFIIILSIFIIIT
ncbi:hypothetical protein QZH41_014512, partial [Actinostola sp. cb2023]